MTKCQVETSLAESTGLRKKEITDVFAALEALARKELKSKGVFPLVPGLIKAAIKQKKATAARMGRNPSTGEPVEIKAKPAKMVAKVYGLKKFKDIA